MQSHAPNLLRRIRVRFRLGVHRHRQRRIADCLLPLLVVFVATAALEAQPAPNPQVEALRREMEQMRADYEARMQQLEQRLRELEKAPPAATTNRAPVATAPPAVNPPATAAATSTNASATLAEQLGRLQAEKFFPRDTTESREQALAVEERRPVTERIEKILHEYIDIGGYFRAGYGRNSQGGPQEAFKAPGALSKYRLGNETESYGELVFGKNWYRPGAFALDRPSGVPTGPVARTQIRLAFVDDYATHDFRTSLPEAWASIGNVFANQPELKFWAGNRFFRRHDIHISDFYFYNMSGYGGGVEDYVLPWGKLALSWIGNTAQSSIFNDATWPDPANKAGFSKQSLDLRLYDAPMFWGHGEFGLAYADAKSGLDANGVQAADSSGFAFNFVHTSERLFNGRGVNKFSLQTGNGAAKNFASGFETFNQSGTDYILPDAEGSWRFRATEHFIADLSEAFSIGPALVYQYTDYDNAAGHQNWFSAGVRPMWHFNKYFNVAFEGGVDWVDSSYSGTGDYLYKLTLAPEVSLGNLFMSRPALRAYLTYAGWGDGFKGQVGGLDFRDRTDGWAYGIQMETWW